ncbi:kinase-like protein [Periconia macrospinosa]|uniref:Kinase-like protein n=1 Tax=Periconia macrospinosa TaxID=97972 RepID=A0A2V1D2W1_9PLEO|nr:kinase-like protein [Periconia macrospinosa]
MSRQLPRNEYTVGWVCALPIEFAAAQEMLDEAHARLHHEPGDNDENMYALGSIGGHNVAIGCLPAGRIGNNPASAVAMQMRATFKGIRFGLMVGIGGGVPSTEVDIRLGDVVVSQPDKTFGGVVQYDAGKATASGFERTGFLNAPPQVLLSAVAKVRAHELRGKSKVSEYMSKLEHIPRFQRSKTGPDVLFDAGYDHEGGQTCDRCRTDRHEARESRDEEVVVHYGTIASGNQMMKSAGQRDKVSEDLGGVLCFEMEAAGLMNSFPCLAIRGICDYADSHKNKKWQPYAAGIAAAYAKEVLSVIPPADVAKTRTVEEAIRETVGSKDRTKPSTRTESGIDYEGQHLEITNDNDFPFKSVKHLGMGGSASVEMVMFPPTGLQLAHKVFRKPYGGKLDEAKRVFRNEVEIIKRLSIHPHIIRVFATYSYGRTLGMLLMPVADSGDLGTYLQNILDSGGCPTPEQATILNGSFGCLANGLAFIHKHTIRHKDIKPQNILVHHGSILYTDFGVAFDASEQENTTTVGNPGAHTRRYCAPEVARWENRNRKSDIFSLGCVFIDILAVLEPHIGLEEFESRIYCEIAEDLQNILRRANPAHQGRTSLLRVCDEMLELKQEDRIDAEALLEIMNSTWKSSSGLGINYFCKSCSPKTELLSVDSLIGTLAEHCISSQSVQSPASFASTSLTKLQNIEAIKPLSALYAGKPKAPRRKKRSKRKNGHTFVKEGWGTRENFQASYGLGMDPEDIAEGDAIIEAMERSDRAVAGGL